MCRVEAPCGGVLVEDLVFRQAMETIGVKRRQYRCINAHSHTVNGHGGLKKHKLVEAACQWISCGRLFHRLTAKHRTPTYCSRPCRSRAVAAAHRKLDEQVVAKLYAEGHSVQWIARRFGMRHHTAVLRTLRRIGVTMRPVGRIGASTCKVGGCQLPPEKRTTTKGWVTGTRCKGHKAEHDRARQLAWWRKKHGKAAAA